MARSMITVRVRRPQRVTFASIASHSWTNEPAWESEVLAVQPDRDGLRVGGRVAMTRRDFGKVHTTTYEITALDPPRRLAVRHLDGPMDFALEFIVAPAGPTESDVTVIVDAGLRGAMRVLAPVFALIRPRQTARISQQMAAVIEGTTVVGSSDAVVPT
jgi:hypothetical protein